MLIRMNYANELSKHLKWHISDNIYNDPDMLKRARVSYKHDQVVFLDYFSLDLDIYS